MHEKHTLENCRGAPISWMQATDAQAFNADWFEFSLETEMVNVTRFDPFANSFEDLFRGFLLRPLNPETRASA